MKLFHAFDTMDWTRVFSVIAAVTAIWAGLISIVPEKYHHIGLVILSSVTSGVTMMMRSGKSRVEKIEDKIEEHREDGIIKTEEVRKLIASEVKEQALKP